MNDSHVVVLWGDRDLFLRVPAAAGASCSSSACVVRPLDGCQYYYCCPLGYDIRCC